MTSNKEPDIEAQRTPRRQGSLKSVLDSTGFTNIPIYQFSKRGRRTSEDTASVSSQSERNVSFFGSLRRSRTASRCSSASLASQTHAISSESNQDTSKSVECRLCLELLPSQCFPELLACQCIHVACHFCLLKYLTTHISESKTDICCPQCSQPMHPNDINSILTYPNLKTMYEDAMLRTTLSNDPDTRWCPAPKCDYAVIATGGADNPKLQCQRKGCNTEFCYFCAGLWHPNRACYEKDDRTSDSEDTISQDASVCGSFTADRNASRMSRISNNSQNESMKRASNRTLNESELDESNSTECAVCLEVLPLEYFPVLFVSKCSHMACKSCLSTYLYTEITESRVDITCPQCSEPMHPDDIRANVSSSSLWAKYEEFMMRRVLANDPDTRWCPAPDCTYGVIVSGRASALTSKIKCERPGCNTEFCYNCKGFWHPYQSCFEATFEHIEGEETKPCPKCKVAIAKIDKSSCNHMTCGVCGTEFCWLCLNIWSDDHFRNRAFGCPQFGKPWSLKKRVLFYVGVVLLAPIAIALLAILAIPSIVIGVPVKAGKELKKYCRRSNKIKRRVIITVAVVATLLVSPILAGLAVAVGVPLLFVCIYVGILLPSFRKRLQEWVDDVCGEEPPMLADIEYAQNDRRLHPDIDFEMIRRRHLLAVQRERFPSEAESVYEGAEETRSEGASLGGMVNWNEFPSFEEAFRTVESIGSESETVKEASSELESARTNNDRSLINDRLKASSQDSSTKTADPEGTEEDHVYIDITEETAKVETPANSSHHKDNTSAHHVDEVSPGGASHPMPGTTRFGNRRGIHKNKSPSPVPASS